MPPEAHLRSSVWSHPPLGVRPTVKIVSPSRRRITLSISRTCSRRNARKGAGKDVLGDPSLVPSDLEAMEELNGGDVAPGALREILSAGHDLLPRGNSNRIKSARGFGTWLKRTIKKDLDKRDISFTLQVRHVE